MGNFVDSRSDFFERMTPLGYRVCKRSLLQVQQVRSYFLYQVQKNDIWDTKNWFRNEVNQIIMRANLQCTSMTQLEEVVLEAVKLWLQREQPNKGFVDGPWKCYVEFHLNELSLIEEFRGSQHQPRNSAGDKSAINV